MTATAPCSTRQPKQEELPLLFCPATGRNSSVKPWTYLSEGEAAEGHTPVYKLHKYFARRPQNVFRRLIKHYTRPGLGHIYKGHKLAGFLWMAGAIPVGIFVLLAAVASAGFGIGLFFFYLIAVMLHAYAVGDRVAPSRDDEGEGY
jgi:hypothetical protein